MRAHGVVRESLYEFLMVEGFACDERDEVLSHDKLILIKLERKGFVLEETKSSIPP